MKKICLFIMFIILIASLNAEIGWSGNIWPNSGSDQTNGNDITVYYQMWKDGTTGPSGPAPNLSATLYYKKSTQGTYQSVEMSYSGAVGNNDEYSGIIPNTFFYTNDVINFYCEGYDETDMTYSYGTDQGGAGPFTSSAPGIYNIIAGLNQDVAVTFQVYLGNLDPGWYSNGVSVQGDRSPLDWTPGSTQLTDPDSDQIYSGSVTFPAGTNPNLEFKFTRCDASNNWSWEESMANRPLLIDDSESTQIIDPPLLFDEEGTLPVELSSFNAYYTVYETGQEYVKLLWQTASETDVIGFNIFRSTTSQLSGAGNHINIELIPAQGSSSEPQNYSFDDTTVNTNLLYYYWLEVIEYSGISEFHGPLLYIPTEPGSHNEEYYRVNKLSRNYPNPVSSATTIKYQLRGSSSEQNATINIYNLLGQKILSIEGKDQKAELDASALADGIYFYELKTSHYVEIKRLIVMK